MWSQSSPCVSKNPLIFFIWVWKLFSSRYVWKYIFNWMCFTLVTNSPREKRFLCRACLWLTEPVRPQWNYSACGRSKPGDKRQCWLAVIKDWIPFYIQSSVLYPQSPFSCLIFPPFYKPYLFGDQVYLSLQHICSSVWGAEWWFLLCEAHSALTGYAVSPLFSVCQGKL